MDIPQEAVSIQHNTKAAEPIRVKERLFISGQGEATLTYEMFLYNIDTL